MAEMKVKVDLVNSDIFEEMLEMIKNIIADNRIPKEVKEEIHIKLEKIIERKGDT